MQRGGQRQKAGAVLTWLGEEVSAKTRGKGKGLSSALSHFQVFLLKSNSLREIKENTLLFSTGWEPQTSMKPAPCHKAAATQRFTTVFSEQCLFRPFLRGLAFVNS